MVTDNARNILLDSLNDFYVVGLGASAGGYEALEKFFANMPPDSGMAFVVVQHLSPDYKSLMEELLSKHTAMKVLRVEDNMPVRPNCIYLIPPKKTMTIFHGKLFLSELSHEHGLSLPINIFLRSLAEDRQTKAIGIILSGTGSDGTLGIRDIKGAGGMVMVQDPQSAKFDGMPKSAIATGLVDCMLAPEQMPVSLVQYVNQLAMTQQEATALMKGANVDALTRVLYIIKQAKNVDFMHYKPTTIIRRIEKRMGMNQIHQIEDYIRFLENTPTEVSVLAEDLLINVTKFFREPEAFDLIKAEVLPKIFEHRPLNAPLRVWVVGCSTGEEPYSLAMIFREYIEQLGEEVEVKIFATDIDKPSLEKASTGIYSESIIADVSAERLKKYFIRRENIFQINEKIRAMVIFAHQNILKDAPFNRIDLVTCRNLLIYFQEQAQQRALHYIHFALNKDRFLFLGKSETVGEMLKYFHSVDNHWKIFRKVGSHALPFTDRELFSLASADRASVVARPAGYGSPAPKDDKQQFDDLYQELMGGYEPAAILVNHKNEATHCFGRAADYLKPLKGKLTFNLLNMVRDDLSIAVNTAIHRVRKEGKEVVYKDIFVKDQGKVSKINLVVRPVLSRSEQAAAVEQVFVVFEEVFLRENAEDEAESYDPEMQSSQRIRDLENELQITKENLQATVEELETSNEELQATNEELLASNEELQSTNEELQSVNEELITVNSEYQNKLEDLIEMTSDFDNLLNSTRLPMLFLDQNLCIRKFTPEIAPLINLTESDIGRPITHFSRNIVYDRFEEELAAVLSRKHGIEQELRTRDGIWHAMHIRPYHGFDHQVEGVTVDLRIETAIAVMKAGALDFLPKSAGYDALPDMIAKVHSLHQARTERRRAERALRESEARYRALAEENARLLKQARRDADTQAALLHEVNHRVKNNLTAILGLLYTEQQHARDAEHLVCRPMLEELAARIRTMALVHNLLSASRWQPLAAEKVVRQVLSAVARLAPPDITAEVEIECGQVLLSAKEANNVALVVNELAVNTLKHAVRAQRRIRMDVSATVAAGYVTLVYRDSGPGYPEDVLVSTRGNVGLYLAHLLIVDDLGGSVGLRNEQGAVTTLRLKIA